MHIKTDGRGRRNSRIVTVSWPCWGYTREFETDEEADAYILGLRDFQAALANFGKDDTP